MALTINNAINGLSEGTTIGAGAQNGVLATDIDPAGYALAITAVATASKTTDLTNGSGVIQGTYGTLTMNADGTYSFQALSNLIFPPDGFLQDTFSFLVSDGHGSTGEATLTITVTKTGVQYIAAAAGQTVTVGNGPVVVDASLGDVTVKGGNGNDVVIGGNGDNITLGNGNDWIVGGTNE